MRAPNPELRDHDFMNEVGNITAAILAGGAARRLDGRDKGLQPLDGRPLVAWVIAALRPQVDALMLVANRNFAEYQRHAATITDAQQGFAGPLAGISAALAACRSNWLLTVPVDCPLPPPDLAARLLAAADAVGSAHDAWVAHDGERRQPLFALYRPALADSAAAAIAAGQGVMHWQDSIGVRTVDFSDLRVHFSNLNCASDFRDFLARTSIMNRHQAPA